MRNLIDMLWDEWKLVEQQIEKLNLELGRISAADEGCTRIRQIPRIGPVVATAIVAVIGNGAAFRKGRDFAAWLGIVPRQYSTGGKARLLGISKRGNVYLRKILIHGARAEVLRIKRDRDRSEPGLMHSTPEPQERCCGRDGQQARADRMGCIVERTRRPADGEHDSRIKLVRKRRLRLRSAGALSLYRTTTTD
jgi:hypothetical protein